ncbi:hypothetical protein [Bradyrhizobium uaiense]|uniref:Uncharacterized protein n=1 Tax=Bradyrhizobium uaiense TaxID=2594946 RepID=A0A6P1BKF8_9BRAD|nr:hypothetical protein [Bradyrhizobium uaiense]NEU98062.1 hypothetical protein [Bradyrhizobium uaiense]
MSMRSRFSSATLFTVASTTTFAATTVLATTALTTTAAHAFQPRIVPPCSFFLYTEGCGQPVPQADPGRARNRDISPAYMKQSDPRYNQGLLNAGGGGGGGGGGGR